MLDINLVKQEIVSIFAAHFKNGYVQLSKTIVNEYFKLQNSKCKQRNCH